VKRVYGLQVAIMEVLGMAGKLLRIISPDKIKNRDAEYYKQALDLRKPEKLFFNTENRRPS